MASRWVGRPASASLSCIVIALRFSLSQHAKEAGNKPNWYDDESAEHDIAQNILKNAKAKIIQPPRQNIEMVEEILRRDAERRKDNANHERYQHKADKDTEWIATQ